jgi:DNA polymerase-1
MGAFRLARDSDLTLKEAEAFVNTYFERLPNVKKYIEDTKEHLHTDGYVETLMGRRRHFGEFYKMGQRDKARAEREAINMPIQGTAADIMKKAMIELHHALQREKLGALITLQVHDELVLEVPEDELAATARLTVDVMENTYDLNPKLRANAVYGQNWRDMEPVPGVAD